MNKRSWPILLFCLLYLSFHSTAQPKPAGGIKGMVIDSISVNPLVAATVQVFRSGTKGIFASTVTSEKGSFRFELEYGDYALQIDYVGFEPSLSIPFRISEIKKDIDLGTIMLVPLGSTLKEVVVQAEKSSMQLSLDKKIFNVGLDLANSGGTASDILMNIPSVSVDPEGNVKLRGSDNVRILIDGKPSGLVSMKGGSGLNNLQASMVERVEIITNPSARYEAEGSAGILNIILKKDKRQGFNGSVELITGQPANFGFAANLNYRRKNINFFINYGIAYRIQPSRGRLYQELSRNDSIFILSQVDKADFTGFNNNVRTGLDYYFSEKSVITAAFLYRRSQGNRFREFRYEDYLFKKGNLGTITKRTQDEDETEPNTEITFNYKRSFAAKGHELTAEGKYLDYWENSDQTYMQMPVDSEGRPIDPGKTLEQRSLNDEWEKQWLFQVDYVKPLGKDGKFETGIRSSFRNMVNDYVVSQKNYSGGFDPMPGLDNVFVYAENIHAVYGIIGNKSGKFSYQGGLRAEWTDVTTTLRETNQKNPRTYANLFPSGHMTYSLPKNNGVQLSYSRRVRRPFYNDLSPYVTFSDARNFFSGNPDLDPEFSNVFELGHLKSFDKGSFTSSVYFRRTEGKIDRIRSVDAFGNAVTRTENLNSEQAYGFEFTAGYTPYKWWKLDGNVNFFHARVDGSNILPEYKTRTYSWFARQTSRFSLKKDFDLQLRMNYDAPQRLVQGTRRGYFFADLSMSKDILQQKATITLNVLDVLNTRKVRYTVEGPNFQTNAMSGFRPRQINVTFVYRIRQAKGTRTVKIINSD